MSDKKFNIQKAIPFLIFTALVASVLYHQFKGQVSFTQPEYSAVETAGEDPYADLEGYGEILALQKAFVRNAKVIKPSVVSVNNLKESHKKKSSWDTSRNDFDGLIFNLKNWIDNVVRKTYEVDTLGSGVIIDDSGYILTNAHVVDGSNRILVKLSDQREFFADVVGIDIKTDLAVLKIFSFGGFPVPGIGKSDELNVGEWVMAIGNPYGLEGTVTVGVVSGKGRSNLGIATFENFLQTDASINPGNSGGPLINLDGQIVGINTAVAEIGAGVGFAIPIEMAMEIARQLIDTGEVERGWLGVGIQNLTPELAESFNIPSSAKGILINSIDSGAPADKGGLQQGDIIVQFDGQQVTDLKGLQKLVASTNVGKVVPIRVIRRNSQLTLQVKIGKYLS